MDNSIIYKANINDAGKLSIAICALLNDLNQRSGSNFMIDASRVEIICKELLPRENFAAYIAVNSKTDDVLGVITIAQATAIYNGGDFGVITELYVDKNHRSKGVGKALVESVIGFAKVQGWKKIEVGAPNKSEWPRTIDFYKKNGFEEKGPKLRLSI